MQYISLFFPLKTEFLFHPIIMKICGLQIALNNPGRKINSIQKPILK